MVTNQFRKELQASVLVYFATVTFCFTWTGDCGVWTWQYYLEGKTVSESKTSRNIALNL
jgi:hypothetical protein